ncbi:putative acetyl xylan esterase [Delitschia confertaspora ATCC 74209]|uniref:Carboxylic ester hydrolase n=1 Tax=Delitschia confertaspora ATCC 74209 TaxID=1513339 RepID=A0A9P4JPB8_9PLEO|nr:putative acetyl xylan esterase [Delitschia confertaspora ATCC 74209]
MVRLSTLSALLSGLGAFANPVHVKRASLQQITNSGISNPTNVGFYMYVPDKLAAKPGVVVAVHYCTGTAQAYYSGSPYATLAEQYGFVVIYPSSPHSGTCWDVSSKASLTHNGGGDSNAIANMVKWAITKYNADTSKVFVTGTSSGAMMTNVLAATYPELFKAAIAYSGVPAGCFVSSSGGVDAWNSTCAQGNSIASPEAWANVVKNMDPGYTGARPKMQIYHGAADTTLLPNNYNETIKQWSGVFGYNYQAPTTTEHNVPQTNYHRYTFGPNLQGIYAIGVGHSVPVQGAEDMKFFGFSGSSATPSSPATPGTTTPAAPAASTPASGGNGGVAQKYEQCGGIGWTGPTTCAAGSTCKKANDWYSQCL